MLSTTFSNAENASMQLPDVIKYFKTKSPAELALFSEIGTLLKLLLVMPATNAVSEQSLVHYTGSNHIKIYHDTKQAKSLNDSSHTQRPY